MILSAMIYKHGQKSRGMISPSCLGGLGFEFPSLHITFPLFLSFASICTVVLIRHIYPRCFDKNFSPLPCHTSPLPHKSIRSHMRLLQKLRRLIRLQSSPLPYHASPLPHMSIRSHMRFRVLMKLYTRTLACSSSFQRMPSLLFSFPPKRVTVAVGGRVAQCFLLGVNCLHF